MLDVFRRYASDPAEVQELIDADVPSYSVKCGGVEYVIYSPELPHDASWGRATYAFFKIANDQLANPTTACTR